MALRVPSSQIDESDERIQSIICKGCFQMLFVEKGSYCDLLQRCTHCAIVFDQKMLSIRAS